MNRSILLPILAIGFGCRDFTDSAHRRLGDEHVLAGRPTASGGPTISAADQRAGFFVSTDADLLPLQSFLRDNLDISGDLLGDMRLAIPPGGASVRPVGSPSISLNTLKSEYHRLCEAGLSSFPTAAPDCNLFDLGLGGLVDHVTIAMVPRETAVRWGSGFGGHPRIEIALVFTGDVDPADWVALDPSPGRIVVTLGIEPSLHWRAPAQLRYRNYTGDSYTVGPGVGDFTIETVSVVTTGFDGSFGGVNVHAVVEGAALSTFTTLIHRFEDLVNLRWFASHEPDVTVFDQWCTTFGAGGCPITPATRSAILERLDASLSTGAYQRPGSTTLLGAELPFEDAHLALVEGGGFLARAPMTLNISFARAICEHEPASSSCLLRDLCAAPPTGFATLCAGTPVMVAFTPTATPLVIPPSPTFAKILAVMPGISLQLYRVFWEPLIAFNRAPTRGLPIDYRFITMCPSPSCPAGASGVTFVLEVDPDNDGIPIIDDNCEGVRTSNIADADGDGHGDECDPCPTVVGWSAADSDGDGIPDQCDCDRDNDGCSNRILSAGAEVCTHEKDQVFDRNPAIANPSDRFDHDHDGNVSELVDWDDDGVIDDCDGDNDNDGVVDELDNCPWIANPDQADHGGVPAGDACDPLCPYAGAPRCDSPFAILADWFPEPFWTTLPHIVEPPLCLLDGPGCWLLVALAPDWDGLVLRGQLDGPADILGFAELAANTKRVGAYVNRDLDGDGRDELLIGLPVTGEVIAVDAVSHAVRWRISPLGAQGADAEVGAALVISDGALWVGAPKAQNGRGAVVEIKLEAKPSIGMVRWGLAPGEQYGARLAAGPGGEGVLASADRAKGLTGLTAAGRFEWLTRSGVALSIEGSDTDAGPGATMLAVDASFTGEPGLLVASPGAGKGSGLVTMYGLDGGIQWTIAGTKDRFGASVLAPRNFGGKPFLMVGAPGASAVYAVTSSGDRLLAASSAPGSAFGEWLFSGDVDRDGVADLIVGGTVPVVERGK